jgi:hypothetical protein
VQASAETSARVSAICLTAVSALESADHAILQISEVATVLRRIHQTAWSALPDNAPVIRPTEVVVQTPEVDATSVRDLIGRLQPWPSELIGHLSGERAQEAFRRRGLAWRTDRWFLIDDMIRDVDVLPVLPLLQLPSNELDLHVPPHYPSATAFNLPGYPHRSDGAPQDEMARWYRETMPTAGWPLARQEVESLQV